MTRVNAFSGLPIISHSPEWGPDLGHPTGQKWRTVTSHLGQETWKSRKCQTKDKGGALWVIRRSQKGRHEERGQYKAMHNRTNFPHLHDKRGGYLYPQFRQPYSSAPTHGVRDLKPQRLVPLKPFGENKSPLILAD